MRFVWKCIGVQNASYQVASGLWLVPEAEMMTVVFLEEVGTIKSKDKKI